MRYFALIFALTGSIYLIFFNQAFAGDISNKAVLQECNIFKCKDTDVIELDECMKLAKNNPSKYQCKIVKHGLSVVINYPVK